MMRQYDSDVTLGALKRITKSGTSEEIKNNCRDLLHAVKEKNTFLEHIRNIVRDVQGRIIGDIECSSIDKMSENEFSNMNWTVNGQDIWENLKGITPIEGCRGGLWLYLTICAIESGAIEPSFLASTRNASGIEEIDAALEDGGGGRNPLYLKVSRRILRTSFGSISERGAKAVFTDVPFARIWWQRHLAEDISKTIDLDADAIMAYFTDHPTIWELLTMKMASKLTVVADRPVRDSLVSYLVKQKLGAEKDVDFLTRRLGNMLAWRALGALDLKENGIIVEDLAESLGLHGVARA